MQRLMIPAALAAALAMGGSAWAQQARDFSKVEINTTDLGHKTYMLEGEGRNITVAVGGDGVIMIAAKLFADFAKKYDATDQQATNFARVVYHSLKS